MQLSRFTLCYEDVAPGEHVLYSVLTDRYVGLDDDALAAVRRWSRGQAPATDEELQTAQALHAQGVLARDRAEDDARLADHLREASRGLPDTLRLTWMPTLACDLACTYCFQKESPAFGKMSQQTEECGVAWVLARVIERGLSKLHVHYFGGEPLTRKDNVLRSAMAFATAMRARGGSFEWSMTTNATQLTTDFVEAMLACGRGAIKVTLDGDRETHDQVRVYRDGRGSFDRIFENLRACAPLVPITVGGNFEPADEESYLRLLRRLDEAGLTQQLAALRFKPVVDVQRKKSSTCTICADDKGQNRANLVQLRLNREVQKRGKVAVGAETLESLLGPCELHWDNNYIIDPEGAVYKCPAVAGRPEMAIANVRTAAAELPAPLLRARPWEKCGDCPYLPVCKGGCLGAQYLKTGRTDQVLCKFDLFEASFREAIPQRYLTEFPPQAAHAA